MNLGSITCFCLLMLRYTERFSIIRYSRFNVYVKHFNIYDSSCLVYFIRYLSSVTSLGSIPGMQRYGNQKHRRERRKDLPRNLIFTFFPFNSRTICWVPPPMSMNGSTWSALYTCKGEEYLRVTPGTKWMYDPTCPEMRGWKKLLQHIQEEARLTLNLSGFRHCFHS